MERMKQSIGICMPRKKPNFCLLFRTPQEVALVRLAAQGRGMPLSEFIRIAALRAACDVTGRFGVPDTTAPGSTGDTPRDVSIPDWREPGAAEIIVAKAQWDTEVGFQRNPLRPHHIDVRVNEIEQVTLLEFRRILGAIVHGREDEATIGFQMTDWLRQHAWRIKSNRTPRLSGLSHVTIPNGGAMIKDGTIHLAVGPIAVQLTVGKIVRRRYPRDCVLHDALVSQITGGRWRVAFSEFTESKTQKKRATNP